MENKLINKMREGTQKKGLIVSLILFFLIIISILPLTLAQPIDFTIIPTPDGNNIEIDSNGNIFYNIQDEVVVNEIGEVVLSRKFDPHGVILDEWKDDSYPGGDVVSNAFKDKETDLYVVDGAVYDSGTGVWLGLHWPTLGRELGSGAANLGLNIVTLGFYGHYKKWQMYQDYPQTIPKTWGEVGSQTLDAVPVVGSIKGAIESDSGLDRAGHISNAVGGAAGLLLWYKAYTAPEVAYVDPNGVTIMSKTGCPSRSAFASGAAALTKPKVDPIPTIPITDSRRILDEPPNWCYNPWAYGKPIVSEITKEEIRAWRMSGGGKSRREAYWVSSKYPTRGMESRLSLPPWNTGTEITKVVIPPGIRIQVGIAAPIPEWGRAGGAIQIQILEKDLNRIIFIPVK